MTVDGDIIGRIGEYHIHGLTIQQGAIIIFRAGVAAEQPVPAQLPEIAHAADRNLRIQHRYNSIAIISSGRVEGLGDERC